MNTDESEFHDAAMSNSNSHLNGSASNETSIRDSPHDEPLEDDEELMSDVPIDTADHGASLPSAEELRHSLPPSKRNYKYCIWGAAAVMLIVVCLSLGVGVSNNKKQQLAVDEPPPRQATLAQVTKYIAASGFSSAEVLQKGGSPQSLAANWMANLDGQNLALPSDKDGSSAEGYRYLTRYTLGLLWYAMEGTKWTNQFGFLSQNDFCSWNSPIPATNSNGVFFLPGGAYCDRETGELSSLHLDFNKLAGSIPSELTKLTTLRLLALDGNKLRGNMGAALCKLHKLTALTMAYNELLGTLPPCISTLTDLNALMVSNNYLHGQLPDFTKLTKLASVLLDDNDFTGDVTSTFNKMPDLKYLYLQENAFEAKLGADFLKNAKKLERIDVSNCKFIGQLPTHLFEMPKLELMDFHGNRLSGAFPTEIKTNSALKYLAVHQNRLKGQLHPSIKNLTKLFHLDVSNNTLTGTIPGRIGAMGLSYLFLANNNFTQGPIPSTFGQLVNLTEISLKGTNRNGTIPKWIGQNLTKLKLLDLDNNFLTGGIPTELGLLTDLEFLLLNRNLGIKGQVPQAMNKLSSLRSVFLDGTGLNGSLAPLCKLPNLNTPDNDDKKTMEYVVADCGGNHPRVNCSCCDLCCSNANPHCNKNVEVASIDPNWESAFARVEYSFGTNQTNFEDRVNVPNP